MGQLRKTTRSLWKSAQLYIGFHVDRNGRRRREAKVWPPKDARATLTHDPSDQEAFVVMKSADPDVTGDVQIKLREDKIVLRRDTETGWQGVVVEDHQISVQVGNTWLKIDYAGSVSQDIDGDITYLEADGSVLKKTEYVVAEMSSDGVNLSRSTPENVAAISVDGVISKTKA